MAIPAPIQRRQAARRRARAAAGGLGPSVYQEPYRAGSRNRHLSRWQPSNVSADSAIGVGNDLLAARIRDLERNDPLGKAAQRKMVLRSVGTGIDIKSAVTRDGEPWEEHNREVDRLFERYIRRQADVRGKRSLYQMQRVVIGELEGPGEALILRCYDPDPQRLVPICYQLLEGEQLDAMKSAPATDTTPEIVRGVELDAFQRPLAYWLFDGHPWGVNPLRSAVSKRYDASRVIHLYEWTRPSQTRGVTPYTATIPTSNDLDWFITSVLKSAHIQTLFTVALHRASGQQGTGLGFGETTDAAGGAIAWDLPTIERLGSGILADLGQYDKIETIGPKHPGPSFEPFVKLLLLILAAGRGLSYVGLTGDYSQTNYSSAMAAGNDDYEVIKVVQQDFCYDFADEVHRDFVASAAAAGLLTHCTAKQFQSDPEYWLASTFHPPGRGMVDEERESASSLLRIFSGQSTFRDELARRGLDWRDVFAQLEREWRDLRDRGVDVNLQMLTFALARAANRPLEGTAA
ncbi:MAG: phage portal protein [Planctomycetaceae bacterium]|nr:phage portal protein [Planctomycetaceae bacterium]